MAYTQNRYQSSLHNGGLKCRPDLTKEKEWEMKKLIIVLIITNIILIIQIGIDRKQKSQSELNNRIIIEELIPIE